MPYYAAPNVAVTFAIAKSGQTINFAAIPDKTFGVDDGDFDVSATASSGLPVSFAAAGPCTVTGVTVHITGVGDCTITASQAGNENYNPASLSRTFRTAWIFDGLVWPVGDNGFSGQAGQTVLITFKLGDNYGLDVLAAGYPKSKPCGAADTALTSTTSANNGLKITSTRRYEYLLKIDKQWAGQCREFVVQLRDNTVHRAELRFK